MKMIGMSIRSLAMRFCRSRPLKPGRETSSMRQLGTRARGRLRNSCADANISAASLRSESTIPATRVRRRRRQQRTRLVWRPTWVLTPLHGQVRGLNSFYILLAQHIPDRLTHSKCDIERLKQSRVAEWLEQARHRTLFAQSRAHSLISLSGDEDDWNLLPTTLPFLLKAGSGHSGHGNVEDQTSGLADAIGGEELFRRRERAGRKPELLQQVR